MIVGITEDMSIDVVLDSELTTSESGLFLNSGVHPSVTVNNLLSFLPFKDVTLSDWNDTSEYGVYSISRKKADLVKKDGKIWQSIKSGNVNKTPADNADYWLETNFDSLKLKNHIYKVMDRVYGDLKLTRQLINSQLIYEVGKSTTQLPGDYSAWVFEPKGSDYVAIRLNQVSFQKAGTTPVNLYVINQGVLIETLEITPSNGIVDFKNLNYTFRGKGQWIFAIDSTDVITGNGYVDPLKYDGFVCYTATGNGASPETATYSYGEQSNGICFNVSCYLDSQVYIDNNMVDLANFVKATFELMSLEVFLHNPENRNNRDESIQLDKDSLIAETKSLEMNTVAKRYTTELKVAKNVIAKTFDTQLFTNPDEDYGIEVDGV